MRVQGFKTRKEAMQCIKVLPVRLNARPEKEYDPKDPNADPTGHIWVVSVTSDPNDDKSYLCTDGSIR